MGFPHTFLYVKQHKITGKLYFGKTIQKNPVKYQGSGIHWNNHLNKHGREYVETLWYCLFTEKEELTKFALMCSDQWDIVKSKEWLNLKPEDGLDHWNGGNHSLETRIKISISNSGPWSDERLSKFRSKTVGKERSDECIQKLKSKWTLSRRVEQGNRLSKISKARYKDWYLTHKTRKEKQIEKRIAIGYVAPDRHLISLNIWNSIKKDDEKFNQVRKNMSLSAKRRVHHQHTIEAKSNMSAAMLGKIQRIVICPHCGKEGGAATMPRWHFDNCKENHDNQHK